VLDKMATCGRILVMIRCTKCQAAISKGWAVRAESGHYHTNCYTAHPQDARAVRIGQTAETSPDLTLIEPPKGLRTPTVLLAAMLGICAWSIVVAVVLVICGVLTWPWSVIMAAMSATGGAAVIGIAWRLGGRG
jgi:hypothetical protein